MEAAIVFGLAAASWHVSAAPGDVHACREYILAMLQELSILLRQCGEYHLAEQLMVFVCNAARLPAEPMRGVSS